MESTPEFSIATLRIIAEAAGLPLTDDDAQAVLAGVSRNRAWAATIRKLVTPEVEPGTHFRVGALRRPGD